MSQIWAKSNFQLVPAVGRYLRKAALNSLQQKFQFEIFINSRCLMERYILVALTQLKPQHVIVLVSRIQKSGTGDTNFVKWRRTFRSNRPKWPDRSKWTTFRAGPEYYGQTKLKWSTNRNFRNFGLKGNKAALESSLWRILRFTPRLHTAYLPNYFKGTVSRNSAKLGN